MWNKVARNLDYNVCWAAGGLDRREFDAYSLTSVNGSRTCHLGGDLMSVQPSGLLDPIVRRSMESDGAMAVVPECQGQHYTGNSTGGPGAWRTRRSAEAHRKARRLPGGWSRLRTQM